jgi:hypothetical protein
MISRSYSAPAPISQIYATKVEETIKILFRNGKGKGIKDLTGVVEKDEHYYIGGGSFGDVYRGIWKEDADTRNRPDIVVKVLRSIGSPDIKTLEKRLKVLLHTQF